MNIEHISRALGRAKLDVYRGEIEGYRLTEMGLLVPNNLKLFEWVGNNIILTTGKNLVLDRLFALSAVIALTHIGVGTDSTTAVVGQAQLNPLVSGSTTFAAFDGAPNAPSRTGSVVTYQATFGTGVANFAWAEAGTFNGAVNGVSTMFNRIVIGPFTKTPAVSIVMQFQITQT